MELCLRHAENPNQPALTSLLVWCGRQRRTRVTGGARLGRGLFVLSAPPGPRGSDACAENNHRVPERSWGSAA